MSSRNTTDFVPNLAAVILAVLVILAALLSGCGGSGGSGQGDRPVGDGQNVQKSQAVVVIHRAGGDEVRDYGENP